MPLTTAAQRICQCAAAGLAALFQSAPLPFSAARLRGQRRARTLAVHPSRSGIHC